MSKRLLISAGTARYENLPEHLQRPTIESVVSALRTLFVERLRYVPALSDLERNPTSYEMRQRLDEWLCSPERNEQDWVVFYYTGHGEVVGSETLYLLTRDFVAGRHVSTAFPVNALADMLCANDATGGMRRVRRLLLILDTCHSGVGALDIARKLGSLFAQGLNNGMFYVLAAAFPNEEAMTGALAAALLESVHSEETGGAQQPYIYFDQLVPAINRRLRGHKVVFCPVASPDEEPQFFPNPRYISGLPSDVSVVRARAAVDRAEMAEFWGPVSRGVELEGQEGWYFTGRKRVLHEITAWLNDRSVGGLQVVTGPPGSGKSAILARVVTLSDPEFRQRIPAAETGEMYEIPSTPLDVAIHAKGKTFDDVVHRLAAHLGVVATHSEVLDAIRDADTPFSMVVDALDEAREASRIAKELIVPLSHAPRAKILVGTRPELIPALGKHHEVLRVDSPDYLDRRTLVDYAAKRLVSGGSRDATGRSGPVSGQDLNVARRVADLAYPSFLVARLYCEYLLALPEQARHEALAAHGSPHTIGDAFDRYLARFSGEETKVRDLLAALAWAEGKGLPWGELWPAIASGLSGRNYNASDVAWALEHAGSFIVESFDSGRSVYRLYHQALADHLRSGVVMEVAHARVARAVVDAVPRIAGGSSPDWRVASPYALTHLAEHAAAAGELPKLLTDPLYLLCADSRRLLSVLTANARLLPADLLLTYKRVVHHIRESPLEEAAAYLELAACQRGLASLSEHSSMSVIRRPWQVAWTRWRIETPSQSFAAGEFGIWVVASGVLNDRPVAVVGRANGWVEVWDIMSDERVLAWYLGEHAVVEHVELVDCTGGPRVVAQWEYSRDPDNEYYIGVYDVLGRSSIVKQVGTGVGDGVSAACVVGSGDAALYVTAHADLCLRAWTLPALRLADERPLATRSAVYGLCGVVRGGVPHVLSMGDRLTSRSLSDRAPRKKGSRARFPQRRDDEVMLHLWSLPELRLVASDGRRESGVMHYGSFASVSGLNLVAVSQNHWGPTELWDVDRWRVVARDDVDQNRSWFSRGPGRTLLLSVDPGRLRVHEIAASAEGENEHCDLRLLASRIAIDGDAFSGPVEVYGRVMLLGTYRGRLRIWDVEELVSLKASPVAQDTEVSSLAGGSMHGLLFAGTDSGVVAIDGRTGAVLWREQRGSRESVRALALSSCENILVCGDRSGGLAIISFVNGARKALYIDAGRDVGAVACVDIGGEPVVFATVERGGEWAARAWDAKGGDEIDTGGAFALDYGQQDKEMKGLALAEVNGSLRVAFASKYGKVMVGQYPPKASSTYDAYQEWPIACATNEYVRCLATLHDDVPLLVAGTERGHLALWEFGTGKERSYLANAHKGEVSALTVLAQRGRRLLASGGSDGMVRLWTSSLREIVAVEIGTRVTSLASSCDGDLSVGTSSGIVTLRLPP